MNDLKKLEQGIFLPEEDDIATPAWGVNPDAPVDPVPAPADTAPIDTPTDPVPAPADTIPEPAPADPIVPEPEWEPEDFQQPLLEIVALTAKIKEAMEAWDTDLIAELMAQVEEKVADGAEAITKSDLLRTNADEKSVQLLEDKLNLTSTLDWQKNLVDGANADPKLKDLVVLAADPTKTEEFTTALMDYVQDKLEIDVKSIIEQKKETERAAIAATDATPVSTPNLGTTSKLEQGIFLSDDD